MQNSLLEQFCAEHQEPIVAIAFDEQNTMSQALCLKCWPQNYNKKVLLLGDVLDITKNIKEEYQQFDVDIKHNIKLLYQLMQELEKLKIFMKQSINEQIKAVNDWIKIISEQDQIARSSIQMLSFDLNTSYQITQQQIQESQKQKEKSITFIQQQLKLLKENEHQNKCLELLELIKEEKFDPPQNQNVQQHSQNDKSTTQQNNLVCQEHQNEIIMVDLNQKPKLPQRLACVYCIQNYPTQYTAIKVAQKLWKKQETQKVQNLNKYSESIDKISQSFNSIKNTYNEVIKDVTTSLSQNNKEIKQKTDNFLNHLDIDWSTLKNDDITEMAEKLCQNDQKDVGKSKIYLEVLKINQDINLKINDAFNKLKQSQYSSKSQIKQLINKDYFGQNEAQNNQIKEIQTKTQKDQTIEKSSKNKHRNKQVSNDSNQETKSKKKKNTEQINNQIKHEKMNDKISKQENGKQTEQTIQPQITSEQSSNEKKFYFKLNSNSINQDEICRSFSFNSESTYLIAACDKSIKLFKFNQGKLILLRILNEHPSLIVYCTFLKNQLTFVSGCYDGSMLIWSNSEENEYDWKCEQKLNEHKNYFGQIIHSKIDNMIISSNNDKTIKFWKKSQNWELHQTLIGHNQYVCSISLNESENKLISGAYDDQILVSEPQGEEKIWTIKQVIKVEWGRRLCFIQDNIFTFQPCKKDFMQIYQEKESKNGFYKTKEIAVKSSGQNCLWLFPQQFSKKQGLLLNKNCHTLNIIRWKGKTKFVNDQAIDFGTNEFYGSMSDDGLWLVTWDNQSKQIQIRSLQ